MPRGPYKFTERDVKRAMRAAFAAGAIRARVEIVDKDGTRLLVEGAKVEPMQVPANDFDSWKAKHAGAA